MKYAGLIGAIFWLAIGMALSIYSTRYEIGSLVQPGPGFFPLGLGMLLTLLSLGVALGQVKRFSLDAARPAPPGERGWKKVAYTVSILAVAALFFERAGYLLTFFLLVLLLMRVAGGQSWKRIFLVAFGAALGVYTVFVLLLEQPLPRGLLGV